MGLSLDDVLTAPASPEPRGPRTRWLAARDRCSDPFTAALAAAYGAQTVGEAFFAGYQAAVERATGERGLQSLLVNEPPRDDGPPMGHPRSIRAAVREGRVSGEKAFALEESEVLWVLVRTGISADGRIPFGLARVERDAPGVSHTSMPMSWLHDVPHCAVHLGSAASARVIPDAWVRIIRPFRTIEDLAVLGAVLACRLGQARSDEEAEGLLALLVVLDALWGHIGRQPGAALSAALEPFVVRTLSGCRSHALQGFAANPVAGPLAESWASDHRLLALGQAARNAQLASARASWPLAPMR
jgi:hypothetical protein